jgi:hypothetical protein
MLDQLELFQVLNQEQQNEVDRFVERQNKHVTDRIESMEKTVDMLKEAGFKQGENFSCSYTVDKQTSERSFGYGDNKFTAEVTFNTISGCVYLKHKRFHDGELKSDNSSVNKEGDKLMCSRITPQYRAYKPTTLLEKLNFYNENQQWRFDSYNEKKSIFKYTVDKYSKLYPNADIKAGTGYSGRSSFQTVLVSFPSGSWVELRLGWRLDEESTHKKFDAKVDTLKGMDLLNHFNQQS